MPRPVAPLKLPYSLAKVQKQQERFVSDTILSQSIGQRLEENKIPVLAEYLWLKVGCDSIDISFYAMSLDQFRGKTVERREWHRRLRRIVAAVELYRACPERPLRPVTDWQGQNYEEWSPVLVRNISGKPGTGATGPWLSSCLVLAGTAAEVTWDYTVSQRMAYRIASMSGFSQKKEKYKFVNVKQLMSLNLLLLIQADSTPDRIKISDIGWSHSMKTNNRKIIQARYPGYRECSFGLFVGCHQCGIGLDFCDLATQRQTDEHRKKQFHLK